jgi:hypothetical protein
MLRLARVPNLKLARTVVRITASLPQKTTVTAVVAVVLRASPVLPLPPPPSSPSPSPPSCW